MVERWSTTCYHNCYCRQLGVHVCVCLSVVGLVHANRSGQMIDCHSLVLTPSWCLHVRYCHQLGVCLSVCHRFNPRQSRWRDDWLLAITAAWRHIGRCSSWRLSGPRSSGNGHRSTRCLRPTQTLSGARWCRHRSLPRVIPPFIQQLFLSLLLLICTWSDPLIYTPYA